jgi:signal transduction histidine kinase
VKKNIPLIITSALFCILFLGYLFRTADEITKVVDNLKATPNIIEVTDKIQSELLVTSVNLDAEGNWTKNEFRDDGWKKIKIPEYNSLTEKDFKEGNFAYYRIKIPGNLLTNLKHLPNEIYFAPQYIMFSRFEIIVNGSLYRANHVSTNTDSIMTIPLADGKDNLIAIKGWIKTGDIGLTHRSKIYIGKGSELNELHRITYKGMTVFPMIFILSIGSVIFLFTLIYLVIDVPRSFEKFIGFGICVIIEKFCTSDEFYGLLTINQLAHIFTAANIGACVLLFWFFCDATGRMISQKKILVLTFLLGGLGYLIALDTLHTNYYFNFSRLLLFWSLAMAYILIFFLPKFIKTNKVLLVATSGFLGLTFWSIFFGQNVGHNYKTFGSLILFFAVAYETFLIFRNDQILLQQKEKELLEQAKDVAIGKTAALLAHDVRRPLEQMRLVLDQVLAGDVSTDFLKTAKEDVEFSLSSVNHQVSEIMNFSRSRSVNLVNTSFYRVLASSVKQVMMINPGINIQLNYSFEALISILGDESRLASLITNLLTNAVEAIRDIGKKNYGKISLSTRIENNQFVLTILNDGPPIPDTHIKQIFDPLFSYGKSQGTGLGLASVLRTAHDHKGSVSVENTSEGVLFLIKLLTGTKSDSPEMSDFYSDSSEYSYKNKAVSNTTPLIEENLRVLILDDDKQVYDYFLFLMQNSSTKFTLTFVTTIEEAQAAIAARRYDLYILDFDLTGSQTGLDFYRNNLSFLSKEVIIHTNRDASMFTDYNCLHLEKPILATFFYKSLDDISKKRPQVFVIDDSKLVLIAWKMFHGQHNCITAGSPEEALEILKSHPAPSIFIIDFYFKGSIIQGDELAEKLKEIFPSVPILVSSSSEIEIIGTQKISKRDFEVRKYI